MQSVIDVRHTVWFSLGDDGFAMPSRSASAEPG